MSGRARGRARRRLCTASGAVVLLAGAFATAAPAREVAPELEITITVVRDRQPSEQRLTNQIQLPRPSLGSESGADRAAEAARERAAELRERGQDMREAVRTGRPDFAGRPDMQPPTPPERPETPPAPPPPAHPR